MRDEEKVADILADWCERRDRGERLDPETIVQEHPDLAEALVARFAAIDVFDRTFARASPGAPRLLGDFRIVREIGRGGMGIVYEAEQVSMGRPVALKVLSPATTLSERAVSRFRREAQAAGRLHHTHIVPVYAMGEERGIWFYAMELVRGRTLAQVIEDLRRIGTAPEAPSPPTSSGFATPFHDAVATQFAGVAEALDLAHAEGIVHRDVKPSNLILDAGGVLKVMDFGLARVEGETAWRTLTGEVIGTPAYMSPEQTRGDAVDARTDVYSLGATLYELLTLEAPFGGRDLPETCANILSRDPARPRRLNPRIPRDLETVVLKAMEKDRRRRYATAGELACDLRAVAEGGAIRARRVGPLGRAWRKVRRHPLRSALVAAVVVLSVTAAATSLHASREASLRRSLEYERLCAEAEVAWGDSVEGLSDRCVIVRHDAGRELRALLDRAIALEPDRIEAYVGRALLSDLPVERRLSDIEAARIRGLGARTYHRARASILSARSHEEAAAQDRLADAVAPSAGYLDAYFEGQILVEAKKWRAGAERLTEALRLSPRLGFIRDRALLLRGRAREGLGDLEGAIEDLSAMTGEARPSYLVDLRIASLWRRLGRESLGEERFRRILATVRVAGTERAWTSLCDQCAVMGDLPWAERGAEEGQDAFQDSAELLWRRASYLTLLGREADARFAVERAMTLRAVASHAGCEAKARVLGTLGRNEEALDAIDSALRASADCGTAWGLKALILRDLRRPDDALAACDEGVRVTGSARLWRLVGDTLADQGRHAEAIDAYDRLLVAEAGDIDTLYNRANSVSALERWSDAIDSYDRVLAIDHAHARALIMKAGCCCNLGRHDEALALLERADESGLPARNRCVKHEYRGNTLLALNRLEEALEAYDRVIAIDAGWVPGHTGRSIALRRLGRHKEALAAADEAVRRGPRLLDAHQARAGALDALHDDVGALEALDAMLALDPRNFVANLRKGGILDSQGRPEEALPYLEAAVRLDPSSADALNSLGIVLNNFGRCAEGLAVLDRAIGINDRVANAHANRSYSLWHLGRPQDALAAARRAVELDPKSAYARFRLGCVLDDLGDHRTAIEEHREAIRLDPSMGLAHNNLGTSFLMLGNPAEAVPAFDDAIRLLPKLPNPRFGKGAALLALGRHADALREYDEAARLAPQWAPAHHGRGKALAAAGRNEDALRAFDEALKLNPGWSDAHVDRGDALEKLHRFDEAIRAFTRAAELDPQWATPPGRRGYIRCLLFRPLEAIPDLERAVQLDAQWPWVRWHLAIALRDAGRFEDALTAFARLSELCPDDWGAEAGRADLLTSLRRFDDALKACESALARFPDALALKRSTVACLRAMGRPGDARRLARNAATGEPDADHACDLAYLFAAAGMHGEFAATLKRFGDPENPVATYVTAQACALLGDEAGALRFLREAAARGIRRNPKLAPDPHFEPFRRKPGFEEALGALLLPE